jgi:hypothetical protein
MNANTDFSVIDQGATVLVLINNPKADAWAETHMPNAERRCFGCALVFRNTYWPTARDKILAAGLTMEGA